MSKLLDNSIMNTRKDILLDAGDAVLTSRELQYGKPESNFQNIANLWNAYWEARYRAGVIDDQQFTPKFTPADVAIFLDLVKTARLVGNPTHYDSWVDKAGYSACGAEVSGAKKP